ncbi:unnamed protein product, partial [Acanthoscelides obtectus]
VPKEERAKCGVSLAIKKKYENSIKSWDQINERIVTVDIELKSHPVIDVTRYQLSKKGNITPYKKVQADNVLRTKLLVFNYPKADPNAVADAGKHFLLAMFGAKNTENLDSFRYQCYLQAVAKQPIHSLFKLAALPPTSAASRQHAFRTYH